MAPSPGLTLVEIAADTSAARRLRDAAGLLDYLISLIAPAGEANAPVPATLAGLIRAAPSLFPGDQTPLLRAAEASDRADAGETVDDPAAASSELLRAAETLLDHLPPERASVIRGRRPVVAEPPPPTPSLLSEAAPLVRDLRSFLRLAVIAILAGGVVFGLMKATALFIETPAGAEARTHRAQARAAEASRREAANAARASIGALLERARAALAKADDLVGEVALFEREYTPLFENERGLQLAHDTVAVETLTALLDKPRPTAADAKSLRERIDRDLVQPLAAAYKLDPPTAPDSSRGAQLDQADRETTSGLAAYRDLRMTMDALLSKTKPDAAPAFDTGLENLFTDAQSAPKTLAEAVERVRQSHVLAQQQAVLDAAAKEREAAAKVLAEAERAKTRAEAEIEAQRARAEAAAKQREAEQVKAKAEADRLRAIARNPAIIAEFSQFLSPGHVYFLRNGGERWYRSDIAYPMSYSTLKDLGATSNWQVFAAIAAKRDYEDRSNGGYRATSFSQNDRPGVWRYPSTTEEVERVKKAMQLFNKLAPFWIEQGKLLR